MHSLPTGPTRFYIVALLATRSSLPVGQLPLPDLFLTILKLFANTYAFYLTVAHSQSLQVYCVVTDVTSLPFG